LDPGLGTITGVLEHKASDVPEAEFITVDYHDKFSRTPLMYASIQGYKQIVSILLQHKADPNIGRKPILGEAMEMDLASGNTIDTSQRAVGWNTALLLAAHFGQVSSMK